MTPESCPQPAFRLRFRGHRYREDSRSHLAVVSKTYKQAPDEESKVDLEKRFDELFATQTCSKVLDTALRRVYRCFGPFY